MSRRRGSQRFRSPHAQPPKREGEGTEIADRSRGAPFTKADYHNLKRLYEAVAEDGGPLASDIRAARTDPATGEIDRETNRELRRFEREYDTEKPLPFFELVKVAFPSSKPHHIDGAMKRWGAPAVDRSADAASPLARGRAQMEDLQNAWRQRFTAERISELEDVFAYVCGIARRKAQVIAEVGADQEERRRLPPDMMGDFSVNFWYRTNRFGPDDAGGRVRRPTWYKDGLRRKSLSPRTLSPKPCVSYADLQFVCGPDYFGRRAFKGGELRALFDEADDTESGRLDFRQFCSIFAIDGGKGVVPKRPAPGAQKKKWGQPRRAAWGVQSPTGADVEAES